MNNLSMIECLTRIITSNGILAQLSDAEHCELHIPLSPPHLLCMTYPLKMSHRSRFRRSIMEFSREVKLHADTYTCDLCPTLSLQNSHYNLTRSQADHHTPFRPVAGIMENTSNRQCRISGNSAARCRHSERQARNISCFYL
jgi:hypothetical protein